MEVQVPDPETVHSFQDVLSSRAFALFIFSAMVWLAMSLKMSFGYFLVFCLVDNLAWVFVAPLSAAHFGRSHPEMASFFPHLRVRDVATMDPGERQVLVNGILAYPDERVKNVALFNILKVLPVWLFVYLTPPEGRTGNEQFLRILHVFVINTGFLLSMAHSEWCRLATRVLKDLHALYDLSDAFRRTRPELGLHQSLFFDRIGVISIAAVHLSFQTALFESWDRVGGRLGPVLLLVTGMMLATVTLFTWAMARQEQWNDVSQLLDQMDRVHLDHIPHLLPLAASPLLARCQLALNGLIDRLDRFRRELGSWAATREDEERRVKQAEIVSLVVHDLTVPLQAMALDLDLIRRTGRDPQLEAPMARVLGAVKQASAMVQSLRGFLRGGNSGDSTVTLSTLQEALDRMLTRRAASARSVVLHPLGGPPLLAVSRLDLLQVVMRVIQLLDRCGLRGQLDPTAPIDIRGRPGDGGTLRLSFELRAAPEGGAMGVSLVAGNLAPRSAGMSTIGTVAAEWELLLLDRVLRACGGAAQLLELHRNAIAIELTVPGTIEPSKG